MSESDERFLLDEELEAEVQHNLALVRDHLGERAARTPRSAKKRD
jgi:hypothetical protein